MNKRLISMLSTLFLFIAQMSFAALEDTYGYARWTPLQNSVMIASFGIGNSTDSYTDWLVIPDGCTGATLQCLGRYGYPTYAGAASIASASWTDAITNATIKVEIALTSDVSASPTASIQMVHDVIRGGTDALSIYPVYSDDRNTNFPAIPTIYNYGIYRFPLYGEKVLRVRFDRSGTTTARYNWVLIRFNRPSAASNY